MSRDASQAGVRPARRLSAVPSILCLALIVGWPALSVHVLAFDPETAVEGFSLEPMPALTAAQRVTIVVVGLAPVAGVIYALLCARRCFQSFRRGEYFTLHVVRSLRGLAAGIVLWAVAGLLVTPVSSLLLTLGAEEHRLTVELSSTTLLTLLFSGIVWQIADVMTKAVMLAEENAQFV